MKKKGLAYYLSLDYPITVTKKYDGNNAYFEAGIPDLPGCNTSGKTMQGAIKSIEESKLLWIKASLKRNLPIPEPVVEDEFSGKLLLRIPAKLHMKLSLNAKDVNLSLNQHIRMILESSLSLEDILAEIESIKQNILQLNNAVFEMKGKIPEKQETADYTFSIVPKEVVSQEKTEYKSGPNIIDWKGTAIN